MSAASILGWLVFAWIILTTVGVAGLAWVAAQRPWYLRTRVPAPRDPGTIEWAVPDQDNPIPGV